MTTSYGHIFVVSVETARTLLAIQKRLEAKGDLDEAETLLHLLQSSFHKCLLSADDAAADD